MKLTVSDGKWLAGIRPIARSPYPPVRRGATPTNASKYQPHQGDRERARRKARIPAYIALGL